MALTSRQWSQVERDYLNKYITADFDTGLLYWKCDSPGGIRKAGDRVKLTLSGPVGGQYLIFPLFNVPGRKRQTNYKAHLVIWFLKHGEQAAHTIDHINRIKTDNRLINLREATQSENLQNIGPSKRKREGTTLKGVHCRPNRSGYWSTIRVDGFSYYLGQYPTELQAARAYDAASIILQPNGYRNFPDSDYTELDLARMRDRLNKFIKRSKQTTKPAQIAA